MMMRRMMALRSQETFPANGTVQSARKKYFKKYSRHNIAKT